MHKFHPFHMVEQSPWPILSAFSILMLVLSMILWFHFPMNILLVSVAPTFMISILWWRDIVREATFQGWHSSTVEKSLKWGMILFITSEIMFFFSFFWSFFHSSLSPSLEIGSMWPPTGIKAFNPLSIPLLNTAILVSSGATVTWAHHSLIKSNLYQSKISLMITIILGVYFSLLQAFEYSQASFSMSDSSYGTTFFVATGFHGLHVIIGSTFLMICLFRMWAIHFSNHHHLGFEMSAWYWHFVDVVWLFLFITIYWWGT